MERGRYVFRTAGLILLGALLASGVSALVSGERGATLARMGVADLIAERIVIR